MTKRLLITALAALGAFVASASVALAIPLYATRDAQVFAVQDLQSAPIAVMPAGTISEGYCVNGGWCFVNMYNGWVSAGSIDNPPAQPQPQQPPQQPQPQQPQQPNNPGPGFSFDFNIGGGNNNPDNWDDSDDGACFYTNTNFRGRSFCVDVGEGSNRLPSGWNDAISSIEVFGDAEVDVCVDRNLRGLCSTIRRDTSRLPSRINDRISSFEVY